MSNGKLFYTNLIQTTAIACTTEAVGFGKEYIGNNNQGVVWRSTGITQNTIQMSFTAATPVKGIVVINHNLVAGDTFVFECSSSSTFATVAKTTVINWSKGFIEVDWNYRYYRLRLQKTTGTYIQVGEIYLLGGVYEFERNFQWNYSYSREINRNATQTTSGQVYRKTRFIRKGFNLQFSGVSDTQKGLFEIISENDYICFLPTGSNGAIHYGYIDFSDFTHVYNNYWNVNATFMENPK